MMPIMLNQTLSYPIPNIGLPSILRSSTFNKLLLISILFFYLSLGFLVGSLHQSNIYTLQNQNTKLVSINSNTPQSIEVTLMAGQSLELSSDDNLPHVISLIGNEEFLAKGAHQNLQTGEFKPGEKFRIVFDKPGIYQLQDSTNPDNLITVIVKAPTSEVI